MTHPVRLRLSRRKGFDLQAHSHAINGLPAVNVAHPFRIEDCRDAADAVARFRTYLESVFDEPSVREAVGELRGRNLACWCPLDQPCHADVLLELANRAHAPQGCEEVAP